MSSDCVVCEIDDNVRFVAPGSCLLVYREDKENTETTLTLNISGWRGTSSLRCYMSQFSTVHLLRLLGEDVSKYG